MSLDQCKNMINHCNPQKTVGLHNEPHRAQKMKGNIGWDDVLKHLNIIQFESVWIKIESEPIIFYIFYSESGDYYDHL